MTKRATTIDEQIVLLKSRGLTIDYEVKAKEILLDVGYYRLGFYLFPFEKTYPRLYQRSHEYVDGALFSDVVNLYYFDFDLRLILMRYLNRIEIAFRTALIYHVSNKYPASPTWFVDTTVVDDNYAKDFCKKIYTTDFKRTPVIARHHKAHLKDVFAPAWKTIEFMTFGAVLKLYEQLKNPSDKIAIANVFGVRQVVTFENYMHTIRNVRNACAYGLLLYDLKLPIAIRKGPALCTPDQRTNIIGALNVIKYMMSTISLNRAMDLCKEVSELYVDICTSSPKLVRLIPDFTLNLN